eukprot:RCo018095
MQGNLFLGTVLVSKAVAAVDTKVFQLFHCHDPGLRGHVPQLSESFFNLIHGSLRVDFAGQRLPALRSEEHAGREVRALGHATPGHGGLLAQQEVHRSQSWVKRVIYEGAHVRAQGVQPDDTPRELAVGGYLPDFPIRSRFHRSELRLCRGSQAAHSRGEAIIGHGLGLLVVRQGCPNARRRRDWGLALLWGRTSAQRELLGVSQHVAVKLPCLGGAPQHAQQEGPVVVDVGREGCGVLESPALPQRFLLQTPKLHNWLRNLVQVLGKGTSIRGALPELSAAPSEDRPEARKLLKDCGAPHGHRHGLVKTPTATEMAGVGHKRLPGSPATRSTCEPAQRKKV